MFNQFTDATVAAFGLALLLAGLGAFYFVGRQSFTRRNEAGVEEFKSFPRMLVIRFVERTIQVVGVVIVVAGFALMLTGVNNNMARKRATTEKPQQLVMASKASDKVSVLAKRREAARQQRTAQ